MGVSVDTGGKGGKKPVDAELNLVPFIDLLVCCICFLLITAVWTQLARIKVQQAQAGSGGKPSEEVKPPDVKITIMIGDTGYTVTAGADRLDIPKQGEEYNMAQLGQKLRDIKTQLPEKSDLTVAVEDGVAYRHMITAMDVALEQHFNEIRVKDATATN